MSTFITLIEVGAEHEAEAMRNVGERYEEAVALVESQGGEVKGTYYGDIAGYDAMVISEFPDRESLDKADIRYSMTPSVRTDVFEAHEQASFASLVEETLREHGGDA